MVGTRFRSLYILYNSYTKIKKCFNKPFNTTLQNKLGTKMFKDNYNYITVNQKSGFYLLKTLENNVHNNSTKQVHHHMPHIHLKA